jgi:hypothetical protein
MEFAGEVLVVREGFIAAEGEVDALPSLGSLVKTRGDPCFLFLVVDHYVESKIPGRVPASYGLSMEELKKLHPHVFYLQRWMFQVVLLGESLHESLLYPEKIPPVHSLLYEVEDKEFRLILKKDNFIDLLFSIDEKILPRRNELILKLLKNYIQSLPLLERNEELERILRRLSLFLRGDYHSLKMMMDILEASIE